MLRWRLVVIVAAAIAISYLDRQTLPVAIKAIEQDIPITNEQFSLLQSAFLIAYALMYAGGGKLMDTVGTRTGFMGIMLFWSLACASHALARGVSMLAAPGIRQERSARAIAGRRSDNDSRRNPGRAPSFLRKKGHCGPSPAMGL